MTRIAPSILAADFGRLNEEIEAAVTGGADWIHVDVMDGRFVPNLTFGGEMIRAIRKIADIPIDVHLMVEHPEQYFDDYVEAGADTLTFHIEATRHAHRHVQRIHELGVRAGVALNPGTALTALDALWDDVDLALIMSVNPGWAGQPFLPGSLDRVRVARDRLGGEALVEIDGGITATNAAAAVAAGADVLVSGSGVYGGDDPAARIRELRRAAGA